MDVMQQAAAAGLDVNNDEQLVGQAKGNNGAAAEGSAGGSDLAQSGDGEEDDGSDGQDPETGKRKPGRPKGATEISMLHPDLDDFGEGDLADAA